MESSTINVVTSNHVFFMSAIPYKLFPYMLYKMQPDVGDSQNNTKRMGGNDISHTNDIIITTDMILLYL